MKTRRLALVALAAAVVLGTTGCNMIAPQATTIAYSAAEGVNIPGSGPLKVRNALFVTGESGESANFLAAIVNDTGQSETLMLTVNDTNETVRVPANSTVSLGADDAEPILFSDLDTQAGTNIEVSFQSGDGESVVSSVPVLDGTLDYLADFVPAD